MSVHPFAESLLKEKFEIKNNDIAKIEVWADGYLWGIKFFDKKGTCFLNAGTTTDDKKKKPDIVLQEGERLVGIRSKLYNKTDDLDALHCNPVFVLGRLE